MKFGKYYSISSLSETVSLLTNKNDLDQALKLIHDFVERIITEPLCTSMIFGSRTLDDLCQRIGNANLAIVKREILEIRQSQLDQPVFAYVVTKLLKSGGHTRVIEDFIKAHQGGLHVILSTELEGKSDTDYLKIKLAKQANIVLEQAPIADYQQLLTWLQKRLIELDPKKVYLFNHHQDSVAVAAIQPDMNLDASFYHHGDHHLCLGVYLPHLKHIDPHSMGYHNCRDVLGIANIYVPLTFEDKGRRPADLPFLQDGVLTTCTAAMLNKIEIPYFVSYLDLVPKLLKATGGQHIHIGRLTPRALVKIRRGLKLHGIKPDRFIYTPWVPSVWNSLLDHKVDLYISSFPISGGLTLIEAMGAGIPVVLHKHIASRLISGIDLAYNESFCWRYPEDLINYCLKVTPEELACLSRLGREHYEKYYRHSILEVALKYPGSTPIPPSRPELFDFEADEWACLTVNQIYFQRLARREMYRLLRYIRSKLNKA